MPRELSGAERCHGSSLGAALRTEIHTTVALWGQLMPPGRWPTLGDGPGGNLARGVDEIGGVELRPPALGCDADGSGQQAAFCQHGGAKQLELRLCRIAIAAGGLPAHAIASKRRTWLGLGLGLGLGLEG